MNKIQVSLMKILNSEKVKKLINDLKDIQFYDLNVFKKYGKKLMIKVYLTRKKNLLTI